MKPIPAIVEQDVEHHTKAIQAALRAMREAAKHEAKAEERASDAAADLTTARDVASRARLALGKALMAARPRWPQRGPNAKGWGVYLAELDIDEDTALKAMKYAGWVAEHLPAASSDVTGKLPTMREAGLDDRPRGREIVIVDAPTAAANDEAEVVIDRDTWCTPKAFADAIGEVDYDPCSNERSHVRAKKMFRLDRGEDGLKLAKFVKPEKRVFINPPYSNVTPWIVEYGHTRFCFLLKIDPSTKWFGELFEKSELILIPRGTRIQFEPPPGVPAAQSQANPFPHGFFFAHAVDAPAALVALCFPGWTTKGP